MAAVPSIGRANRVEGVAPAEADLTRELYERYANQIFRYCLHQLGSREEAEDAVQSTFLNAFRGIKRGVVPELESAWLFKIAHNVCLSRRRSTWRRGRIESPADFEVVEELTPAPSRLADELIGLQGVLEGMPESQRRAILLREWQGLSYREIADELDLSQAAVETLIFRARRALASGLEQPPGRPRRRGIARAADLGNLATAVKSLLLGGSAAAKVAATVAVVSATTVVAAAPVEHHRELVRSHAAAAKHATPAKPAAAAPTAPAAPAPVHTAAAPAADVPVSHRHRQHVRHAAPVRAQAARGEATAASASDHGRGNAYGHEKRAQWAQGGDGQGSGERHATDQATPFALQANPPDQMDSGSHGGKSGGHGSRSGERSGETQPVQQPTDGAAHDGSSGSTPPGHGGDGSHGGSGGHGDS